MIPETVYKSDGSSSDSSNDSINSSNNESDDTALASAVINDNSEDQEEILHQNFMWETMDNYTGHRKVFSCDSGPSLGTENVSDIVESFELIFDKEIIQQIVREINRYEEQHKNEGGNLFLFCSFVRLWISVMEN